MSPVTCMPYHVAAVFALVIMSVGPVSAADPLSSTTRSENDIWLTGPMSDQPELLQSPGSALVCGMRHRGSTLSVRAAPETPARALAELPYYTVVEYTGDSAGDGQWLRISGYTMHFDTFGRMMGEGRTLAISGWVNVRYLCSFIA